MEHINDNKKLIKCIDFWIENFYIELKYFEKYYDYEILLKKLIYNTKGI